MCGVERCEGDDKESGGIFPSIHQVREGSLGVAVTPEALDEAEPGGQTLDDGAQAVRVAVAHVVIGIWNRRRGRVTPPRRIVPFPQRGSSVRRSHGDLSVAKHFQSISSVLIGCVEAEASLSVVHTDSN